MIQAQTILKVSDNSGAKTVKCFKVIGGFKKKYAFLGDLIIASVQKLRYNPKKKLKLQKGDVVQALIIKTKATLKKKDGTHLMLNKNSVILLNKQNKLIGTRIIGPITKTLKARVQKLASVSGGLI